MSVYLPLRSNRFSSINFSMVRITQFFLIHISHTKFLIYGIEYTYGIELKQFICIENKIFTKTIIYNQKFKTIIK